MTVIDNVLYADEGMLLTDGIAYGKVVYLGEGADASEWREITENEYEAEHSGVEEI